MLSISDTAQQHFRRLLEQQGIDGLGIRIKAIHAGTPKADCVLEFCEPSDLTGDEREVPCSGFVVFVDAASVPYLDGAELDYAASATGGQLTIRAPKIKGVEPGADASLAERIEYLLLTEINPQIAHQSLGKRRHPAETPHGNLFHLVSPRIHVLSVPVVSGALVGDRGIDCDRSLERWE